MSANVNDRRQIEKAIQEGRGNVQDYLGLAGVLLVAIDTHKKVAVVNKKACEILECDEPEILGQHWFDNFVPKSISDKEKAFFEKVMAGETRTVKYHEAPVLTKSGMHKTIGWHNTKLTDERGKIIGLLKLGEDITKWKKLERILAERVKELQCFYAISEIREKPHVTLDELYVKTLNPIHAAYQYPDITCVRVTISDKRFETPNFKETEWQLSSSISVNEERIGEVMVCYLEERPELDEGPFLKEERFLLNAVAERLGRIAEHFQIEEAVHKSERLYHLLFDQANDGIIITDLRGNVVMANKTMAELTGYTVDELTNMNLSRLLSESSFEIMMKMRETPLENLAEAIGRRYQLQMVRKSGEERIIEVAASLLASEGQAPIIQIIARDVTREKLNHESVRSYAGQVIEAQERERNRIARELHDETTQALASVGMDMAFLIESKERLPKEVVERLKELRNRTNDILQGVRYLSQALRPPMLEDLGLLKALEWLTNDITDQQGIDVRFEVRGSPRRLSPELELALFRIAQEALNNVVKHSEATEALVEIKFNVNKITLTITDNGQGFELPEAITDFAHLGKMGLMGMQERARLLGSTLTVTSALGTGTTISVETLQ